MPSDQSGDGADRREASSDAFDRWMGKAADNTEEWGEQSIETLLLAAQEELGELTQATLEYRSEDGHYEPILEEIDDLGALLIQLHDAAGEHRFRECNDADDDYRPSIWTDGGEDSGE